MRRSFWEIRSSSRSCSRACSAIRWYIRARESPITYPIRTPTTSPPRIVAMPKSAGIGQAKRSGLRGTEPTRTPTVAPTATPRRPTARAFA